MQYVGLLSIAMTFLWAGAQVVPAYAQGIHEDVQEIVRARVENVLSSETREIPGTDTKHLYQRVEATVLEGPDTGERIIVENDFLTLEPGDYFFAIHYVYLDGEEMYSVQDIDRRGRLYVILALFAVAVVLFGGWYGVRALASLVASLFVLAYVLVPGLVAGWNPLVACFAVASAILGGVLFLTHGFNRESAVAFLGTVGAVALTLLAAAWAVSWADLSGFAADESVSLNFGTRGALDLVALLVGGIVIGALGVLDDIAITQVAIVRELYASQAGSARHVFLRAMRVGREHVGAVVNTLALAYVGVSLPLILFLHISPIQGSLLFNLEIFATEIVRTVVGSIGIITTVPIVTALAVHFLKPLQGERGVTPSSMVHSGH
jgi:uncharacterized membrane protein